MRKGLVPCAMFIIGSVLVGCSGNEGAKIEEVPKAEIASAEIETKELEIDKATATAAVEDVLPSYFKLLEEGDLAGYWELFEMPADEETSVTVQKMMDAKITTKINEMKVLYQKENEVLATFDMKQVAEEYHPIDNFNRFGEGFIVLKKVDEDWKISQLDYITLFHHNHDGERESYVDVDNVFTWSKELAKLKREKLSPSEWAGVLLADIKKKQDSIPDQPLQYTEDMLDNFSKEDLIPLQKVLNQLGDAPKDKITINDFLLYEEHLESGYIVYNVFIRNGFDYPVSNLHGTLSIVSPAWDENDERVEMEVASGVFDLSEVGTIEPGSTAISTLYFHPETLLVNNIEEFVEFGEMKIKAELTHTGE